MITKRNLANLALTASLAFALCLTGCGNRLPANAPVDEAPAAETPAEDQPAPVAEQPAPVTPVAPVTGTPAYEQPTVGSLTVSVSEKKKKGLIPFMKKLIVKGQVLNTSTVALSGKLKIEFRKKGSTVETREQEVATLQPGQSYSFDVTSEKYCDDAEVTVETRQSAPAAAGYGASPYGQSAYAPYGARTTTQPGPYGF